MIKITTKRIFRGHLRHRYSVTVNQFMVETVKRSGVFNQVRFVPF